MMYRRDLKGSEKALGPQHPDSVTSIAKLASTLSGQRWREEAEDMEVQVMETRGA